MPKRTRDELQDKTPEQMSGWWNKLVAFFRPGKRARGDVQDVTNNERVTRTAEHESVEHEQFIGERNEENDIGLSEHSEHHGTGHGETAEECVPDDRHRAPEGINTDVRNIELQSNATRNDVPEIQAAGVGSEMQLRDQDTDEARHVVNEGDEKVHNATKIDEFSQEAKLGEKIDESYEQEIDGANVNKFDGAQSGENEVGEQEALKTEVSRKNVDSQSMNNEDAEKEVGEKIFGKDVYEENVDEADETDNVDGEEKDKDEVHAEEMNDEVVDENVDDEDVDKKNVEQNVGQDSDEESVDEESVDEEVDEEVEEADEKDVDEEDVDEEADEEAGEEDVDEEVGDEEDVDEEDVDEEDVDEEADEEVGEENVDEDVDEDIDEESVDQLDDQKNENAADTDAADSNSDSSDSSIVVLDTPNPKPAQLPVSDPDSTSITRANMSISQGQAALPTSSLTRFLASRVPSTPPPHRSHFQPHYHINRTAYSSETPGKTLFKSRRVDWGWKEAHRRVSSLSMRRKNPLGMDEFKAGMRVKQQARIASMIRDAYRAMRRGTHLTYDDFHSLVRKRMHLQKLMDLETLRTQPLTQPVLDEQAYTQRTLEALCRREVQAQAQLPPPIVPKEARIAAVREARRKRQAHSVLGRKPLPAKLAPDAEAVASAKLQQRTGIVASMTGAQVEAHDMAKLLPGKWLNDEVINFYGQLLIQRSNDAESLREHNEPCAFWRVHVFSSFFWQNLTTRGYAGVRRWSRRVDLFTKDLVMMPINVGQAHWVCAAINLRLRRFEYYDSMGMPSPSVFATMRTYMTEEMRDKKQLELDLSDWEDYFAGETSPQQHNGYDCGVFAVQTLEQLSRRDPAVMPYPPPLNAASFTQPADPTELALAREEYANEYVWNFSQHDMPYLRRRMAYEIGTKQLLP